MATGTRDAPAGRRAKFEGDLIQFDQFIDAQLQKTGSHVRSADLAASLILLSIGGAAFFLVAALLDHWIVPGGMGVAMRCSLLALGLGGVINHFYRWLMPLLRRKINPVYAAHTIERSQSSLKNALVNFLFFRSHPGELSPAVYSAIEEQAATRLARVPVDTAVDRSRLIRLGYVLLAALVIAVGYKLISPKDPFQTVSRVLLPWARIAAPTIVTIDNIEPGDATVAHGSSLNVSAVIRGIGAGESAAVVFSTTDQQVIDRRIAMSVPSGDYRFTANLPGGGDGIQQPIIYRIVAGDAVSPEYRVDVTRAPSISVRRVDYEYPAYTGLAPQSVEQQGDIKAIEGAKVTIHATANDIIASGYVELVDHGSSQQPLTAKDSEATTSFRLALADDRRSSRPSGYSLHFKNPAGQSNQKPVRHQIEVVADLPPIVEFLSPQANTIQTPLGKAVKIEVAAHDPDFGLRRVRLIGESAGQRVFEQTMLDETRRGHFMSEYRFRPQALKLEVGQEVECWVEVEDNREPTPNRSETSIRKKFKIVAADEPGSKEATDGAEATEDRPRSAEGADADQTPDGAESDLDRQRDDQNLTERQDNPSQDAGSSDDRRQRPDQRRQERRPEEQERSTESSGDELENRSRDQDGNRSSSTHDQDTGSDGEKDRQQRGDQGGKGGASSSGGKNTERGSKGEDGQATDEGADENAQRGDNEPSGAAGGGNRAGGREQPGADSSRADGKNAQPGDRSNANRRPSTPIDRDGASDGDAFDQILRHREEQAQRERSSSAKPDARGDQNAARERGDREHGAGDQSAAAGEKPDRDASAKGDQSTGERSDEPADASAGSQGEPRNDKQRGKPTAQQDRDDPVRGKEKEPAGDSQVGDEADGSRAADRDGQPDQAGNRQNDRRDNDRANDGSQLSQNGGSKDRAQRGDKGDKGGKGQSGSHPTSGDTGQERHGAGENGDDKQADEREQGDDAGSPEAQRDQRAREDNPQSSGKTDQSQPQSPSNSREQSKSSTGKKGESGDQSGAGGKGGGQKGSGAGKGEEGQNTPDDQGSSRADERGSGETGERAGHDQAAQGKTGESGKQRGKGSSEQAGDGDSGAGKPDQANSPASGDERNRDSNQRNDHPRDGQRPAGDGAGGNDGAGARQGSADSDANSNAAPEDAANLDYARRATELALEHLEHELSKDQPDQALLDRLGWSKEDLRQFAERWRKMLDRSRGDGAGGESTTRELDPALRSLGLRPRSASVRGNAANADKLRHLKESRRSTAPPEYQEHFKAYQQGTARGAK